MKFTYHPPQKKPDFLLKPNSNLQIVFIKDTESLGHQAECIYQDWKLTRAPWALFKRSTFVYTPPHPKPVEINITVKPLIQSIKYKLFQFRVRAFTKILGPIFCFFTQHTYDSYASYGSACVICGRRPYS